MKWSPSEFRLVQKALGLYAAGDEPRNELVLMRKSPARFSLRGEITPEVVEKMKELLSDEAKELARLGYIKIFVDGKNVPKDGNLDFVAHVTKDGYFAFKAYCHEREAIGA